MEGSIVTPKRCILEIEQDSPFDGLKFLVSSAIRTRMLDNASACLSSRIKDSGLWVMIAPDAAALNVDATFMVVIIYHRVLLVF